MFTWTWKRNGEWTSHVPGKPLTFLFVFLLVGFFTARCHMLWVLGRERDRERPGRWPGLLRPDWHSLCPSLSYPGYHAQLLKVVKDARDMIMLIWMNERFKVPKATSVHRTFQLHHSSQNLVMGECSKFEVFNALWTWFGPSNIHLSQNNPSKCDLKLKMKTSLEVLNVICPPQEPTSVGHCHYKKWSKNGWLLILHIVLKTYTT